MSDEKEIHFLSMFFIKILGKAARCIKLLTLGSILTSLIIYSVTLLTTDAPGKRDVSGHESDSFGMNGT